MLITKVLCSDYIGPARLRLNLPELAPELKRVCHPWATASQANACTESGTTACL